MVNVVGVRFKDTSKMYYFDPNGLDINKDDYVIVETAKGTEYATAVSAVKKVNEKEVVKPLKPVLRIANEADVKKINEIAEKEKHAHSVCIEKIREHGLDMSLTGVVYNFDMTKITFYFTADSRVDFRALVKDLAAEFHTRIELRQIGVRDEAKMIGGLGMCGRPFCCSTFLNDFHTVSIKMAKEQGIALAPGKISGTCGRLMCCLKYEQDAYEHLNKIIPHKGTIVDCREGRGVVVDSAVLTGKLKVQLDDTPQGAPITVNASEVRVVKKPFGKAKKD